MGQALRGVPEAPSLDAAKGGAPFSIGAHLARQRRLRGISLEELEVTTRIPRRSLERLEAGAFDRDRDAFARSFVKSVAQALGLDVNDTITRMLAEVRPHRQARGAALLRSRAVWLALVAVALVGLGVGALRWLGPGLRLPSLATLGGASRPVVVRPDPVRALAREAHVRAELESRASQELPSGSAPPAAPTP